MRSTKLILGLAVMSVATSANAATVAWNVNSNGSWDTDTNWLPVSVPGASDHVVLSTKTDTVTQTANRTITLGGDRAIGSLEAINNTPASNYYYAVNPGTPSTSKLTINTGNITVFVPATGYSSNSTATRPLNLSGSLVQIGDGVTPVSATWDFTSLANQGNVSTAAKGAVAATFGELAGIAGTQVLLKGARSATGTGNGGLFLTMDKTSNNWNGAITVNAFNSDGNYSVPAEFVVNASNGLGSSIASVDAQTGTAFQFAANVTQQDASLAINSASSISASAATTGTVTLNGDLSGSGQLTINKRGGSGTHYPTGTVIVNGDTNTHSGGVRVASGRLIVDGEWTGAGTFLVDRGSLGGTGTINLASGSSVDVLGERGFSTTTVGASIVPGTDGTIGTLTINGTGTALAFNSPTRTDAESKLLVDIGASSADLLTIQGDVTISATRTALYLKPLELPEASQFNILTYTGTLTGTFGAVYYDGVLVSDPFADGAIAGKYSLSYGTGSNSAIALIPEPTSLAGLALLGGMLVRRRRSH